jgi:transposase-like protein
LVLLKPTVGEEMTLEKLFCPNIECPARGQSGEGNIHPHSQKEQRCRCDVCGETFTVTKNSIFYRLRTNSATVMLVITLMAYGCPLPAIVKAFGFDERTVKKWWQRAGEHCQGVHRHIVGRAQLDLEQAQADEIKVKAWGRSLWLGLSMMVSTRLWLGGVVSSSRDKSMIEALVSTIRQVALCRPLLIAIDGLPHYKKAIARAFRSPYLAAGQLGRPRLISWSDVIIGQVIKRRTQSQFSIERRFVQGCHQVAATLIELSQGQLGVLNTAYIERLNATFRQRLAWLTRRSRLLAHQTVTLSSSMYIVGCFYNFCDPHKSLRLKLLTGNHSHRWLKRTPAIAAGLADHIWSPQELLTFSVPLPRWTPPKRPGRPSRELNLLIERWC